MINRKIITLLLMLFCIINSYAQIHKIEIGNNGESCKCQNFIFDGNGHQTHSQFIYLANEIGHTGYINKLTFKLEKPIPNTANRWDNIKKWEVRLKMDTQNEYKDRDSNTFALEVDQYGDGFWLKKDDYNIITWLYKDTKVPVLFNGDVTLSADRKNIEVNLSEPFFYNDIQKNLIIEVFEKEYGEQKNSYIDKLLSYNKKGNRSTNTFRYAAMTEFLGENSFDKSTRLSMVELPRVTLNIIPQTVTDIEEIIYFVGDQIEISSENGGDSYEWTEGINANVLATTKDYKITESASILEHHNKIYNLKVTKGDCDNSTRIRLIIKEPLAYCEGDKIELSSEKDAYSYEWKEEGNSAPPITTKDYKITDKATISEHNNKIYSLVVSNDLNCKKGKADKIKIVVNKLPTPTLSNNTTKNIINKNESITFTAGGGVSYEFFLNGTRVQSKSRIMTYTNSNLNDGDKISVKVWNANNCSVKSLETTIKVNSKQKEITLTNDAVNSTICKGEEVVFTASGGIKYEFYINDISVQSKSSKPTFKTVNLKNNDKVSVKVWNVENIISNSKKTIINVNELPKLSNFNVDNATVCFESDATVSLEGTPNAIVNYDLNNSSKKITLDSTGKGYIKINNIKNSKKIAFRSILLNQCETALNEVTEIKMLEKPNAGQNSSINLIEGAIPTNKELFDALKGMPDSNGIWTKINNYNYTYTIHSKDLCDYKVKSTIIVNYTKKPVNAFTPNGDGKNDTWEIIPKILEKYPNNKLHVFNRHGNLVYKASPYKNDWNAVSNGKIIVSKQLKLQQGPYYYVLDLGDSNKTIFKGWVLINY